VRAAVRSSSYKQFTPARQERSIPRTIDTGDGSTTTGA